MSIKWVALGEDTWALAVPGGMCLKVWEYDCQNEPAVATSICFCPGNSEEIRGWIEDNRDKRTPTIEAVVNEMRDKPDAS